MNRDYLKKAEDNRPKLFRTEYTANQLVSIQKDPCSFFGWTAVPSGILPEKSKTGDRFILDFGRHLTGNLSFILQQDDSFLDAPVRLRLKFGEIPYEMARDFSSSEAGLCSSWFQEEIITADGPGQISLPRRYSFRYLELEVLAAPCTFRLKDFSLLHQTSADRKHLTPLPPSADPQLQEIDRIAAETLDNCMQYSYEDGPKRDRRLWAGDLRLQALTDYYLFHNDRLVRRCLYLFAACEEPGKFLPGCLFEKPSVYYNDKTGITDYAMLYTAALCDYFTHTGDCGTVRELFPVAQRQINLALSLLDENGIITFLEGWSSFIDWAPGLKTTTAVEGVILYALEKMAALAADLGENEQADIWNRRLDEIRKQAFHTLFDSDKNAFCNSYDEFQYSVQAQVWMILGGVITGDAAVSVLHQALHSAEVQPVTPYMHHYVTEALIRLDRKEEALQYIRSYWGGMADLGADTFWEVYVPGHPEISPYGDPIIHSFCHAWSCSPSYFIRKYFTET